MAAVATFEWLWWGGYGPSLVVLCWWGRLRQLPLSEASTYLIAHVAEAGTSSRDTSLAQHVRHGCDAARERSCSSFVRNIGLQSGHEASWVCR